MHTRGVEGETGTSCNPSKDFEKFGLKNAIKHENRGPPPIFFHNPMSPSKEFENDCASLFQSFNFNFFFSQVSIEVAFRASVSLCRTAEKGSAFGSANWERKKSKTFWKKKSERKKKRSSWRSPERK